MGNPPTFVRNEYQQVKSDLHRKILDRLDLEKLGRAAGDSARDLLMTIVFIGLGLWAVRNIGLAVVAVMPVLARLASVDTPRRDGDEPVHRRGQPERRACAEELEHEEGARETTGHCAEGIAAIR